MISHPIFNLVVVDTSPYEIDGTFITLPHQDDRRIMPRARKDALDWFKWSEGIPIKTFIDDFRMTPRYFVEPRTSDEKHHLTLFGEFPDHQGIVFKMWMADVGYADGLYL